MARLGLLGLAMVAAGPGCGWAQTSTPPGPGPAGAARPARGPEQSSIATPAPPATPGQATGGSNPNPAVQQMNDSERKKVEAHGK